jgi:hypothetical protein
MEVAVRKLIRWAPGGEGFRRLAIVSGLVAAAWLGWRYVYEEVGTPLYGEEVPGLVLWALSGLVAGYLLIQLLGWALRGFRADHAKPPS